MDRGGPKRYQERTAHHSRAAMSAAQHTAGVQSWAKTVLTIILVSLRRHDLVGMKLGLFTAATCSQSEEETQCRCGLSFEL